MDIDFREKKHERLIGNHKQLRKKYNKKGIDNAEDILAAFTVLKGANTLSDIPSSYRPHPLKYGYTGCLAIDVTDTHRMIFKPSDLEYDLNKFTTISKVTILEIFKDYHQKK